VTEGREPDAQAKEGLAAVGLAAIAVVCCAALPLLAALSGGIAVGAVLGIGAGVLAVIGLVALVVLHQRSRRGHGS
jgi:hypothetical protein